MPPAKSFLCTAKPWPSPDSPMGRARARLTLTWRKTSYRWKGKCDGRGWATPRTASSKVPAASEPTVGAQSSKQGLQSWPHFWLALCTAWVGQSQSRLFVLDPLQGVLRISMLCLKAAFCIPPLPTPLGQPCSHSCFFTACQRDAHTAEAA